MGGLSRKNHVLKSKQNEHILPFLLLDSGNALYPINSKTLLGDQDKITAKAIASIYRLMNYNAVNVGFNDIRGGVDILTNSKVPWISASFYSSDEKPLFPTHIVERVDNTSFGIVGITSLPQIFSSNENNFTFKDWKVTLPQIIDTLDKSCDFIILLSTLPYKQNIKILEEYSAIRLLVSADSYRGRINPRQYGNGIITQTEKKGKSLGFINITNLEAPSWKKDNSKKRKYYEDTIRDYTKKITALQEREQQLTKRETGYLNRLISKRESYTTKLEKLAPTPVNNEDLTNYVSAFHLLKKSLPKDPEIEKIVQDTLATINETNKKIGLKKRKEISAQKDSKQARSTPPLSGSQKCAKCHESHFNFWEKTDHAHAYRTLQRVKQDQNLKCVSCHITLPKKEHSPTFSLLPVPLHLQGVGCESCHGSGIDHIHNPSPTNISKTVKESLCVTCHTKERDGNFNFSKKKTLIQCPVE